MKRRRAAWVRNVLLGVLGYIVGAHAAGAQAPPTRQGLVSLDDARLFYELVGSGPPIMVIHGGPGLDHDYLRPGMDVLTSSGTLVYYDQRGTGRSDAELTEAAVNWDAFVDDIEELRQALGFEELTVMGHSFGALLALDYARRHPDRTTALVLMNPVEPGGRWRTETARRQAAARTPADSAALAALAASPGFEARDAATMSRYYELSFRAVVRDPERLDDVDLELSGRTARNGPEVARLLGTSLGAIDWWDRLPDVDVPTLVIHGRDDAAPVAMAQALVDALPQARLVVLDTGHFPYVEDPAALLTAVSTFLESVRR